MVSVALSQETVGLHNELLDLDPENVARAAEIEWTLRSIIRRDGGDVIARLGLLRAFRHQGKAKDALQEMVTLWTMRSVLAQAALVNLQVHAAHLGEDERAAEILSAIEPTATDPLDRSTREMHLAWRSGDIARVVSLAERGDQLYGWLPFSRRLQRSGLERVPITPAWRGSSRRTSTIRYIRTCCIGSVLADCHG